MSQGLVKFGRNYQLTIETSPGEQLVIKPPFTLELDINRSTLGSANTCKLRLYNLGPETRSQLYFNAYNTTDYKAISLLAGYGDNLAEVFSGNVFLCFSVRQGVDFITQIECYDGGFAFVNCDVNITLPAGTPVVTVIQTLMQSLTQTNGGTSTGISIGAIGNFQGTISRGNTYSGNPASLLNELTGGAFFIDSGKAYALTSDEYVAQVGQLALSQPVTVIDDSTGLLNTPVLEQTVAHFEMLFEPTLNIGRLVKVNSSTFPLLNGNYTITSVKHRGIISPAVSGELITVGEFFYSKEPIAVTGLTS